MLYHKFLFLMVLVLFGVVSGVEAKSGVLLAVDAATQTTISVAPITIPTHPVDGALVYHLNSTYNMYYAQLDGGRYNPNRLENRTYNLIILENNYLKLTLLPELGGRIYQAIYKPTGNNMFYQNPVLKPSPWGPPEMGWWLAAGGMEWGFPVEEHGYEWGNPWSFQVTDLPDGVMVEVWDTTAADRLRTRVAITLPDDTAFFQVTPAIENPTGNPVDFKFWLNAMLAPGPANRVGENLRFVLPAGQVTVHSTGDSRLPGAGQIAGWPVHNGVDWSRLSNWREWYGFFQYPQAAGNFQAVYDEGVNEGAVRIYDSAVARGAKFFAFGHGPQTLPPDLYTDDDSSYVEIHGGLAPTFDDTHRLAAQSAISWNEQWYPMADLNSLTWANQHAALFLEDKGTAARLHVGVTHPVENAQILVLRRTDNQILYQANLSQLLPGQPFHSPEFAHLDLLPKGVAVLIYEGNTLLAAYQYDGGPIPTLTPSVTPSQPSATPSFTPTNLPTVISTATPLPTATALPTASPSPTATVTPLPTATSTSTPLPSHTPSPTSTLTPAPSPSYTSSPTVTFTPLPTLTSTPVSQATPTPVWRGVIKRESPIAGWAGVVRIWVKDRPNIPVTIASNNPKWLWQATAYTGSKAEYGVDALEFAPLPPISYTLTVPKISAKFEFSLTPGTVTEIVFEQNAAAPVEPTPTPTLTPIPSATFTPTPVSEATPTPLPASVTSTPVSQATPTPSPAAPTWHVRVPTNTTVPGNWFAVIRVSVEDKPRLPVRITIINDDEKPWSTTCLTGSKPEFGPYFCEFAPLIPAKYIISPEGLDISTTIKVNRSGLAVVIFEEY